MEKKEFLAYLRKCKKETDKAFEKFEIASKEFDEEMRRIRSAL